MQFNARTTPQTVEALYAIADHQGWLVGETLERALAALQRELAGRAHECGHARAARATPTIWRFCASLKPPSRS